MTSGVPPAIRRRGSYRTVYRQPAWLLLDASLLVVASVRAKTVEEARRLFREAGLVGAWIRRAR